ncbi:MAG: hypothetical protein FWH18_01740 [Marinilabiliaceae bacterium]|nr:hypothetical protein [Marinilabiliaceae bacterium]
MRNLFCVALLATMILGIFSCAKDDPAEGINIEETFASRATVEGTVYLNINESPTNFIEFVPEGTILSFTIPNIAFGIANATGNYVAYATVGNNGRYSVELPTRNDGGDINVTINGNPFTLDVTNGSRIETKLFELPLPLNTQSIISGFTYQKNLTYTQSGDNLMVTETWEKGNFRARFVYNNPAETPIPSGTTVKITIKADQFVPKRVNDYVSTATIGSDGVLTFSLDAPTPQMRPGGLDVTLQSAVILNVTNGDQTIKYLFNLNKTYQIYGGADVDKGTISYAIGDPV